MSDAKPTSSGRPTGGFIVMGVLAGVGVVLWLARGPSSDSDSHEQAAKEDAAAADAGPPKQVFDLEPDPNFHAGVPLRPMDKDIFAAMKDPSLPRERALDLFPDRPYRVRLIGSVPEHYFVTVMIDLTRDGKAEERWDLKGGQVTRWVPNDPNAPGVGGGVTYTLAHGRWQPH